jgi:N-acetylglucosaminylphosphatidylinositol deacetylase
MATALIALLGAPVLFFALWHLTTSFAPPAPATLRNKRIILLIAHPDDESMFFSPTLQALTSPSLENHVKILCLSTGNADGLGDTRRKELEAAAVTLGIRKREDVFILDDEKRFKDGMDQKWSPDDISRVLASAFAPQLNGPPPSPTPPALEKIDKSSKSDKKTSSKSVKKSSKSSTPSPVPTPPPPAVPAGPRATIDVLITFDDQGISSHPNHIALYNGARTFLSKLMRGHSGYACPVNLYTLTTVNIARKYSFIFDTIPTMLEGLISGGSKKIGDKVLFNSDMSRYWKARDAMVSGHKSQMVWFRWGWISMGRYMVVNDLKRERIAGVA